jgi:hypothetical protein
MINMKKKMTRKDKDQLIHNQKKEIKVQKNPKMFLLTANN